MGAWTVYEMANRWGPRAVHKYWAWYGESGFGWSPRRMGEEGSGSLGHCWHLASPRRFDGFQVVARVLVLAWVSAFVVFCVLAAPTADTMVAERGLVIWCMRASLRRNISFATSVSPPPTRTPTHTTTTTSSRFAQARVALCREETLSVRTQARSLVVMAARVRAAGDTSSARRRRERRQRSRWRRDEQFPAAPSPLAVLERVACPCSGVPLLTRAGVRERAGSRRRDARLPPRAIAGGAATGGGWLSPVSLAVLFGVLVSDSGYVLVRQSGSFLNFLVFYVLVGHRS